MSAKLRDYDHYQAPLHGALVDALAALYARAGLAEVRAAAIRGSNLTGEDSNEKDIKAAIGRALGTLGYPADLDDVKGDAEGLAALYRRMGKTAELVAAFDSVDKWRKLDENAKMAALAVVADGPASAKTFETLARELPGGSFNDRGVRFQAAQSWANLAARGRQTKGLADAISGYLKKYGINGSEEKWAVLYAYVLTAEQAGGPELLAPLETLMSNSPTSIHFNHEQTYFSTPEAWAKTLIRTGKFAEYAARTLGPDGAPQPSRLEQMLIDKDHPMRVAAALRAIALARDPSFKPKEAAGAETDVPKVDIASVSSGGGHHGGFPFGQRHDYLMRRFGETGLPPY
jgi:hypothetical protein